MDTPILILAAGQSSRMRGLDKLAQIIDGTPQLTRITAAACSVSPLVFVATTPARLPMFDGLPATPLHLKGSSEGMGGSLRDGVASLPECTQFMVVLADIPDLSAADMRAVLQGPSHSPESLIWRGATLDGQPGHPILFDASLRPQFASLRGDSGGESIVKPLRDRTWTTPLPHARMDLDTPEEWAEWLLRNVRS
jgi:molybdenum cofactor cytidylyltransferase